MNLFSCDKCKAHNEIDTAEACQVCGQMICGKCGSLCKKHAEILEWIEYEQEGRSGIYPYHVARDAALEFGIGIDEAQKVVTIHIKQVAQSEYE